MTTVVNIRNLTPAEYDALDVCYVGRVCRRSKHAAARAGSIWGNPFHGDLERYRDYILSRPDLVALLPTLRGRTLGCWCCDSTPSEEPDRVCHAEILCDLVDALAEGGAS
jgi:hypothetical protein